MKRLLLATAVIAAAALGACSQATTTDAANTPATESMPEPAAVASIPLDVFVSNVAGGDMFEVQAGQLARERSRSAEIREFAQQMVTVHTDSTAQLRTAIAGVTPAPALPTALDANQQAKLDALRAAQGDAFDQMYLDQQTEAHENALTLFRNYAEHGDTAAVRAFAAATAPKIEQHLNQVRGLDHSNVDHTATTPPTN